MKERKAILYVRVSTDEQAEKGHSLAHQEERLRTYCANQNIEIVAFFKEDYSAKTFERPEFNKLIDYLKKNKNTVNLLLFLKWDRFSRNAPESYAMIGRLNKLGVEPQAIEQPLNLEVPEQKFMLALYLTSPEVENDRRSLNVIAGIRRAAKDGRYMGMAPYGYKHARNQHNKPCIAPSDNAPLVRYAFERMATGLYHIEDVRKEVNKKGLKVSRSRFWEMVRCPVYIGKISILAYKDEEAQIVQGKHEPLISEYLFNEVQDVLQGKKRKMVPTYGSPKEEMVLRGFLTCKICGRNLTGSASKGKGGIYFYYHCKDGCKERYRADMANGTVTDLYHRVSENEKAIKSLELILGVESQKNKMDNSLETDKVKKELEGKKKQLEKARKLLLEESIDPEDYKAMKTILEPEINQLVRRQMDLGYNNGDKKDIIEFGFFFLKNIGKVFPVLALEDKRIVVSSTFPEKMNIENGEVRTQEEDNVLLLISKPVAACGKKKEGKPLEFSFPSCGVALSGIEPESGASETLILSIVLQSLVKY